MPAYHCDYTTARVYIIYIGTSGTAGVESRITSLSGPNRVRVVKMSRVVLDGVSVPDIVGCSI